MNMARANDIHDHAHGLVIPLTKAAGSSLEHLNLFELEELMGGEKVAMGICGPIDGHENWLQQFSYTDLYEKAIALAEKELSLEKEEIADRLKRKREFKVDDTIWNKRDQLRLEKDRLILELHKKKAKDQKKGPAKVAGVVEYVGQVNNGEPAAPVWPRAALGVDSAGRKATPEEKKDQENDSTAVQHVEPQTTGEDFEKKVSELVVKMAKPDAEYEKMPWHKKYRMDLGALGGSAVGAVGGGMAGHMLGKSVDATTVGAHLGGTLGLIGGAVGGRATLSNEELMAVLRQRHHEAGETIREADKILKTNPNFLRKLWNRAEKGEGAARQSHLKDAITELKSKQASQKIANAAALLASAGARKAVPRAAAEFAAHAAPRTTQAGIAAVREGIASRAGHAMPISAVRPPPVPAAAAAQAHGPGGARALFGTSNPLPEAVAGAASRAKAPMAHAPVAAPTATSGMAQHIQRSMPGAGAAAHDPRVQDSMARAMAGTPGTRVTPTKAPTRNPNWQTAHRSPGTSMFQPTGEEMSRFAHNKRVAQILQAMLG